MQKAASDRFIGTGLELGGKDPAYVRADADLAHAVENLVDGALFNSGQSCCGIERIYAHEKIYDAFVEGYRRAHPPVPARQSDRRQRQPRPDGARARRRLRARPGARGDRRGRANR